MRYVTRASWGGNLAPYLVGCYEEELHPHVRRLLSRRPTRVVVVGAAEGYYYAVGAAIRLPGAVVTAVDVNSTALTLCRELARRNDVRVRLAHYADQRRLRRWLAPGGLLVCDCEGYELELLDPERVPELERVGMLVELHDFRRPSDAIPERFSRTHRVTLVQAVDREPDPDRYPALRLLPEELWPAAVDERRPRGMRWAVLEPR
jgi:hypothetical protein